VTDSPMRAPAQKFDRATLLRPFHKPSAAALAADLDRLASGIWPHGKRSTEDMY
jgi:hypothetical protein